MPAKPVPKKAATARTKAPAAVSKRDRILDAAQQLFAQGGFDGVSMRDIAAQAGVGLPLIVYHFETKQNLYRALFERFRTLLDARLTALHAPVAPGVDPLEHIVRALVLPVVQAQGGEAGVAYAKLVAREVSDPREAERGIVAEYFDPFAVEFVHAIRTVLPRQDPDYAHWAYLYAVGALVMSVFDRRIERISEGQTHAGDLKNKAEYLVRFIVAGMRAGSSEPDLAGAGQEEEGAWALSIGSGCVRQTMSCRCVRRRGDPARCAVKPWARATACRWSTSRHHHPEPGHRAQSLAADGDDGSGRYPHLATHPSLASAHAQARINDPGRRRQESAPNGCDSA